MLTPDCWTCCNKMADVEATYACAKVIFGTFRADTIYPNEKIFGNGKVNFTVLSIRKLKDMSIRFGQNIVGLFLFMSQTTP